MATIADKVKKIIAEQLGVELGDIKEDSSLVNDFNADSLDGVEIIMTLEDLFEINIPDQDTQKLTIVGEIIKYIKDKKKIVQEAT